MDTVQCTLYSVHLRDAIIKHDIWGLILYTIKAFLAFVKDLETNRNTVRYGILQSTDVFSIWTFLFFYFLFFKKEGSKVSQYGYTAQNTHMF